jgi:hypothetical protein
MVVSAAKLEANRRNAQKSTGPRTIEGKNRSRCNALDHGCRADILIMQTEDPQALQDRKDAWSDCLLPRDDVEQGFVDDAVEYKWNQDRARRAQAARLSRNINKAGAEEWKREQDEVLTLGQKLFADNRGPLAVFPHFDTIRAEEPWKVPRVSESDILKDPEDPQRLVLYLQATACGCRWMLDQWSKLRSILEEGQNWQSPDKLKAVRLLGRQPLEAADDRDVLLVFVACQTMEGRPDKFIPEIWHELQEYEKEPYGHRLAGRGIEGLRPKDAAAAREILLGIIDRATAQITVKADAHHRRAEVDDALAADCLSFDDSPVGERLRQYELASGRGIARSLESLHKHRRSVVSGPLSVVHCPLPVVGCTVESIGVPDATNEPNDAGEIATNEPNDACENATNEPNDAIEKLPNEPNGGYENAMSESKVAADCEDGTSVELSVRTNQTNDKSLASEVYPENAGESFQQGVVRRKAMRAESLRKLNEEARREAADAMAAHRARRREQRNNNGRPGDKLHGRAASAGQARGRENAAREKREPDEFVKNAIALYDEAHPVPS